MIVTKRLNMHIASNFYKLRDNTNNDNDDDNREATSDSRQPIFQSYSLYCDLRNSLQGIILLGISETTLYFNYIPRYG